MDVLKIETVQRFDEIRHNWESVHGVDPNASVFTSWSWLRGWIRANNNRWTILALRPKKHSDFVAFFPMENRTTLKYGMAERLELHMAGAPYCDHTGFICIPDHLEEVVEKLTSYLANQLVWDRFTMQDILDDKFTTLFKHFPHTGFTLNHIFKTSSPYISLPDDWSRYLENRLSHSTRKGLRRKTKQLEGICGFRTTDVRRESLDSDITALLDIWQQTWGSRAPRVLMSGHQILRYSFEAEKLWLRLVWDGDVLVGGISGLIDPMKKSFTYYLGGFNKVYASYSPGTVMIGYSIKSAIEKGLQTYRFQKGDEPYKFSLGACERFISSTIATRRIMEKTAGRLLTRLGHSEGQEFITSA